MNEYSHIFKVHDPVELVTTPNLQRFDTIVNGQEFPAIELIYSSETASCKRSVLQSMSR